MSTQVIESPLTTDNSDDVIHYWCCNEDLGYCGKDLTGMPYGDAGDHPECLLCNLAEEMGEACPVCGIPYCEDI